MYMRMIMVCLTLDIDLLLKLDIDIQRQYSNSIVVGNIHFCSSRYIFSGPII